LLAVFLVLAVLPWFVVRDDDEFGAGARMVSVIILALVTFVPTYIALKRRHPMRTSILVLNLLIGWMAPIWVALLVWATTRRGEITLV